MSHVDISAPSNPVHARSRAPAYEYTGANTVAPEISVEWVTAGDWDRLAATFVDVNQEQTACFCAAKWGSERVEHVVVRDGAEVLGGAVVVVLAMPGISSAISIVKWGPLWRRPATPPDPVRLRAVLTALKQEYAERRGHYLSVHPHADPAFEDLICDTLEDVGFNASRTVNDPDRYLVNVAIPAEELRSSLGQKWRYNLKRSASSNLEIALVNSEDGLAQFMTLYHQMLARKRFLDSSAIATLPALMHSRIAAFRPELIMVHHEGRPTAGAVVDVSGERAVYLYGATDERALGLNAGYALHWWIAERLCQHPGMRWYDLGGKDRDQGLHQFKKGFVGKRGAIVATPPSFEFATSWSARALGHAAFAFRDATARLYHSAHRAGAILSL